MALSADPRHPPYNDYSSFHCNCYDKILMVLSPSLNSYFILTYLHQQGQGWVAAWLG